MSPEERGITLPHYLKAERISNGAMMYIRTTHTPNSMCVQTSPPFKFGGEQKPEDKVHATFVGNGLFQQQFSKHCESIRLFTILFVFPLYSFF